MWRWMPLRLVERVSMGEKYGILLHRLRCCDDGQHLTDSYSESKSSWLSDLVFQYGQLVLRDITAMVPLAYHAR
jgi:hypothetical protein